METEIKLANESRIVYFSLECGGSLSGNVGTIVHPSYPNKYQNDRECNYVITVAPDKIIKVTFDQFDFESSESCKYDYIEITDSYNNNKVRICKAGHYQDFFTSSGRSIVVKFYTDEVGQRLGFKMRWRTVDAGAGIRVTDRTTARTTDRPLVSTEATSAPPHRGKKNTVSFPHQVFECVYKNDFILDIFRCFLFTYYFSSYGDIIL